MPVKRTGLAARRKAVGFSQDQLAERLRVDRSTVARWESGETEPQPWMRPRLARALGISADGLDELLTGASAAPLQRAGKRPSYVLTAPGFQLVPVDDGVLYNPDETALKAFRSADLQVGGGHLYTSVVSYLHEGVAPRLFGTGGDRDDGTVFTAASALTEMAGWMAHDAGHDHAARKHFNRALAFAGAGGDQQVRAHVLGSMSHLASHLGQPDEAVRLARRGQAELSFGRVNPGLKARLLALEARGMASHGRKDSAVCAKLLAQAEQALTESPAEPPSPWVSCFDEGSLASEAYRCMHSLGDLSEAARQAGRVISLRPQSRTRSRALGQLSLVSVPIAQGKPEEACRTARDVLTATQSLSSYVVAAQLLELRQLLRAYRSNPAVVDFLAHLEATFRERVWLYQWPGREQQGAQPGNRKPQ